MTTIALSLTKKSFFKFSLVAEMSKLFSAVAQEVAMQRAINELESLSDRQLRDLGIERHDIAKRVRGL